MSAFPPIATVVALDCFAKPVIGRTFARPACDEAIEACCPKYNIEDGNDAADQAFAARPFKTCQACRAIIRSSSVGITQAEARLPARLIMAPPARFAF
jgi:hypothetical protein